jgi:hypothetical protein
LGLDFALVLLLASCLTDFFADFFVDFLADFLAAAFAGFRLPFLVAMVIPLTCTCLVDEAGRVFGAESGFMFAGNESRVLLISCESCFAD